MGRVRRVSGGLFSHIHKGMAMTFEELTVKIQELSDKGFYEAVIRATERARTDTRLFIARTHPKTAFGGKKLTQGMFIRGKYTIGVNAIDTTIYANYFARWYNTGAFGRAIRASGKRKGMKGTKYLARGDYFGNNKKAIEDFYASCVDRYLEQEIKI